MCQARFAITLALESTGAIRKVAVPVFPPRLHQSMIFEPPCVCATICTAHHDAISHCHRGHARIVLFPFWSLLRRARVPSKRSPRPGRCCRRLGARRRGLGARRHDTASRPPAPVSKLSRCHATRQAFASLDCREGQCIPTGLEASRPRTAFNANA